MKVLILTNYANGLYLFRRELLLSLLEEENDVWVSLPPDENVDKLRTLGIADKQINIIETPFERRGNNPIKDIGLFRTYLKMLDKHKPDVVLTYTIKPNLYGGLACTLKKVPYLSNITGLGTAIEDGGILSRMLLCFYKISMKKAGQVFFQNKRNLDFMNRNGIAVHNYKILPGSGVNLKEHSFEEYPPERKKICFLAVIRIMKDKGIEEYLEAAQIMKAKKSKLQFWLVGEYEEETRNRYEPQIQELERQGIIKYLGHIDNVREVMAACHIIVHPSYHEGLSNVLLEAAACGRPVLVSDINGCIEAICEGESGFTFAAKSTEALVAAMEKILALSAEERRSMGVAGRAWVEQNFDRNIVIQAYKDAIAQVVK